MEIKLRYKARKVKKHWVTVAVASGLLALGSAGLGVSASAETSQISEQAVPQKSETTLSSTKEPTETQETTEQTKATNQVENTEISEKTVSEQPQKDSAAQITSEANTTRANETQEQVTAPEKTVPKVQSSTKTVTLAQRQTAEQAQAQKLSDADLSAIPNVKKIDGKYYYIGSDGQVKKNFALTADGKTLYFDKETGALTDTSQYQFTQGLTSLNNAYTTHNQIVNLEKGSLETVDNYVTADSWYRPKDILKDGKTWTASTESDLRPLLMSWWPDKQTQVAYLNYMNKQGLGTGTTYTADSSQESLNLAAQNVQAKIESKISQTRQTQWLREIINSFVKTQSDWNIQTESDTSAGEKDHLQGGALLYVNDKRTPHADSNYRLLNRTPTSQTGKQKYFEDNSMGGYEFLLANDIDNSNPAVQAEQLNWLHYLMNYGSIVANDPEANFDGVRVDAVDNVNADLLQIASDYFKAYYGVGKSEKNAINHLSILEAWSDNDPQYNKDTYGAQLPIDNKLRLSLLYALARPLEKDATDKSNIRSGLEPLITNSLNDRSAEGKKGERMANYIFIRAHDSEVQTVIAKIIKDNINPNTDGLTFTLDELKQAFKIYNEDMRKANKKYTQSNIPTAYALMLSNKDSITRVYYGDMYTDDGQYMATKSPYYDAIETLMKARIKYAAGGQDMKITYVEGDKANMDWDYTGVLTSVRYGTGANEATDSGNAATKTQGMAVITSNNPSLKLTTNDKVIVNMGAAHKNQEYRPLLLTTKDGLITYTSDAAAKSFYRKTNDKGELVFTASDIQGYLNPQVSGYLAVWVPVGASDSQDVRVAASDKANADGQVYNSSSALDSQLIYEGFSNFQDFVTKDSEYTNKLIAQNVDLFKSWGVTSFEMAPQYVSSEDGSFLDSIILNGYAFEDRYDLAMSKNNKYGSQQDMINAVKALHKSGIQVIADWVPDQIYNLPGKEVVTATRVNNYGKERHDSEIKDTLYVANTKTKSDDYQAKYGGAFLDQLAAKYPSIFNRTQISNGKKIDPSEKITKWEAKYFNGTNILGRGAGYVLKDKASDKYFTLDGNKTYLPKQMTNQQASTGFVNDGKGLTFYSSSGYQAKNSFVQDAKGNWYYFDNSGHMVYGLQHLNNEVQYFLSNGVQLRDAILENADGTKNYFGRLGNRYSNNYYSFDSDTKWRYFDANGVMAVGLKTINGNTQYFDQDGYQVKGEWVTDANGKKRYFDNGSGNMAVNRFANDSNGDWYYLGSDGIAVIGSQTINGKSYYFDQDGKQIKGKIITGNDGKLYYYLADSGELAHNIFATDSQNNWYYFGSDGTAATGSQTVNGQKLYFANDGKQVKGSFVNDNGKIRYYHADSGELQTNRFEADKDGNWYYLGADGAAVTGSQYINNQRLFFARDGKQVKGDVAYDNRGLLRYYDKYSGSMVYNRIVALANGRRIIINRWGIASYL
ncbi:glycoside hydrolase family 70 protein [Streptococcus orisasini]